MLWGLFTILSFTACHNGTDEKAQRLNDIAYASHYVSLDSVKVYAERVLSLSGVSSDSRAEALNHLAFYYIGCMRYDRADSLLTEVMQTTDNHIELCVASVQLMRICQRQSRNKAFYEHRQDAINHLARIHEERKYSRRQNERIKYAEIEMRYVASAYNYYIGNMSEAVRLLDNVDSIGILRQDTALYVAYLYNMGSGGAITQGTKEQILHQEFELLSRCYTISTERNLIYWQANALQSIAEHIIDDDGQYLQANKPLLSYLNTDNVADSLLAGNLAERALRLFTDYGDIYQQAATWRTLSRCYNYIHDYPGAIYSLHQAIAVDSALTKAPALMASLYEHFSLAFSAINNKKESDYYRNLYLDLYEDTRQDRMLEARAGQLELQTSKLNTLIIVIIASFVLLIVILLVLIIRRRRMLASGIDSTGKSLRKERDSHMKQLETLNEEIEEMTEQEAMMKLQLERQQSFYVEQRAKMHLINSLSPLTDRLLHEIRCLVYRQEDEETRNQREDYITELIHNINSQNDFLTRWIKLKQGELSLHIESFSLQSLFDIILSGSYSYTRQGLNLVVKDTKEYVKADKTLTLFMLNTLCDNARKYTPPHGTVTVSARATDNDMIEISISDTGQGISKEQIIHIFDPKPIIDENTPTPEQHSHGFGLLNCKGIIEKYKKTNQLFANCSISAESQIGKGTRFFFTLPRGTRKAGMIIACLFMMSGLSLSAAQPVPETGISSASVQSAVSSAEESDTTFLQTSQISQQVSASSLSLPPSEDVRALADSVYQSNINARYADAIAFADKCLDLINQSHQLLHPASHYIIQLYDPMVTTPAEVVWMRNGIEAPYTTLLSLRNEIAVAALALHQWDLYRYNNSAYTLLFRESSADKTLAEYCKQMEKSESDSNIAIMLLTLFILSLVPIYYFAYYRYVIIDVRHAYENMSRETNKLSAQRQELASRLERLTYEHNRLHVVNNILTNSFSTLKHETMYFPSRILQMLFQGEKKDMLDVATYYQTLFVMLSKQAQSNSNLQMEPAILRDIMITSIARLSGQRRNEILPVRTEDPYHIYEFSLKPQLQNSTGRHDDNTQINLIVLSQVVRDLGEAYNLRRCGVTRNDATYTVTAPVMT